MRLYRYRVCSPAPGYHAVYGCSLLCDRHLPAQGNLPVQIRLCCILSRDSGSPVPDPIRCFGHIILTSQKSCCDQYQIYIHRVFTSGHLCHHHTACLFIFFVLSLYFSCFSVSCSWHAGLLIGSVNLAVFYFASLISLRKNASASEPDA